MKKKKYTEESIQVLEWRDAIRKRPAMYMGSIKFCGFLNIIKSFFTSDYPVIEAQDYSIELLGSKSGKICFHSLKKPVLSIINQVLYLNNVEFAALNALSNKYEFTLYDENKNVVLKQVYEKGVLKGGIVDEKEYFADSLEIKFDLDSSVWKEFSICPHLVSETLKELAFLNKGKTFAFTYLDNNQPCQVIYHFKDGLRDMLRFEEMRTYGEVLFPTWFEQDFENFSTEIGFSFSGNSYDKSFFKSFVNEYYTHEGGIHAEAMISVITKALKRYVKKYCSNDKFLFNQETEMSSNFVVSKRIILKYLIGVIRVKMKQPRFSSYYRTKLESPEIFKPISDFVIQTFFQILENDREKANNLIKHFHAVFWKKSY
jgi:DNA gyrase subunit B